MASNSALGPHSRQRSREHAKNGAGTGTVRPQRLLLKLAMLGAAAVLFLGSGVPMAAQACTPPPANCPCRQPAKNPASAPNKGYTAIDMAVITQREGNDHPTAYTIPDRPLAGVTVGIGVDLGAQTQQGLLNMGVSQALVNKLSPYLQLKGTAAINALNAAPLTLTSDEDAQLNNAAFSSYFGAVASAFNSASSGAGSTAKFSDYPWQVQTLLADLWYNMGHGAPNLWQQLRDKDYDAAYNNLMDFTHIDPDLAARAKKDATLFKQAQDACTLPPG